MRALLHTGLLSFVALVALSAAASADLVHRYSFSGTGTTAFDSVGNAHGEILGGASLNGSGLLVFDGFNDYVNLPNGLASSLTDATFEGWVNWNGIGAGPWQRVFDFGTSSGGEDELGSGTTYIILMCQHVITEHMYAAINDGTGEEGAHSPTGMPVNQWTHVALTVVDRDRLSIYVNGEFKTSAAITIPLSDLDDNNNWLGRSQYLGNGNFWGEFDEFRIYDHAMDDNQVLSSYSLGPDVVEPGIAYCFGDGSGTPCPCGNTGGVRQGCANSTGFGAELIGIGSTSAGSDDLRMHASNLLPGQPGLLFSGDTAVNGGNGTTFGDGLRCAGGSVDRLGTTAPNGSGDAEWGPGLGDSGGWSAGDTRYFQVWYRDVNNGPCSTGFNLSNGYSVQFTL